MATKQMEESWQRTKEHIRKIWGDALMDHELESVRGDLQAMIALVHRKTGQSRSEILQKLEAIL
ncbi:general stress protein CsbD [Rhodothermus bifroesti]|uniref:General stress protein CsbD n=1 Tax=Rhodothermus marinus TaxID=29549 RepID=A0A7V2B112_RHOMR|nr:general stress protein CsbD [Rhodothermus bifroesti]GBD00923.1 hypothetical protein HRbin18_00640 [bacterium HR18]